MDSELTWEQEQDIEDYEQWLAELRWQQLRQQEEESAPDDWQLHDQAAQEQ